MNAAEQVVYGEAVINGGTPAACKLTITRPVEIVSTRGPQADPDWAYTDAAGHFHAYSHVERSDRYPTLAEERERVPCDGSCAPPCEGYTVVRYTCPECGERIEPGKTDGPTFTRIEGPADWRVEVAELVKPGPERVSVRVAGAAGGWFGWAVATEAHHDSMTGPRAVLHGVSALGRR